MQNMTEICLKISKYAVIPIKLKICSNCSNPPLSAFITFAQILF